MTLAALQHLIRLMEMHTVRERIDLLDLPVELRPRLLANFKSIFQ